MWSYQRTAYVEQRLGKWQARVVFADGGIEQGQFVDFPSQPSDADVSARCNAIAATRNDTCAARELDQQIEVNVLATSYQTKGELADRFRAAYRAAAREQAAKMAYWLIERINAGDFTDTQVRTAFGLTTTQYNAMKTRFQTLHDQWATIQSAAGE